MNRRNLLVGLAVGTGASLIGRAQSPTQLPHTNGPLKIDEIELIQVAGHHDIDPGVDDQYQVKGEYIYDSLRPPVYQEHPGPKQHLPLSTTYLRIRTNAGLDGLYGPIDGDVPTILRRKLRGFLLGKDPLAGETLWDQMHHQNPFSRNGEYSMCVSAVDNALWDLRARYYGVPVYRLLGGPSRESVEAYASCLGYSIEPESVRKHCLAIKQQGYRFQKWFMPYGPGSGSEGLRKNVELVRILRETLGDDTELMFDAFSGWDLTYAQRWAREVEQYHPRWIEEAMPTDQLESFATLRRSTSIPVATGEHFFGRWEADRFLNAQAVSVIQADPDWCGGISELIKIGTLASAHDIPVVPHGHGVHAALHTIASQSPATFPMAEYLLTRMPTFYYFEKHPPAPVNGRFPLPTDPGFNIEINPAVVESQHIITGD